MFSLMFVKKLCSVMCLLDSMLYDLNDTCHHRLRLTLRKRLSCWQRREIYVVEQWTIGFKGGRSIMNKNNDMTNAVNDSDAGAFDVEGNPLDTGRLWPINQAALISGVTTRTLRYYDETDLVKPAETSAGGKRWYDWVSLVRLQFVILLRDAGLSIADIAAIAQPGEHNVRQAISARMNELRHDIETIEHKLQVLHNLSDLCDADGNIEQISQLANNPALAGLLIDSAIRWDALSPEEREQIRQTQENTLRQSHETMIADAEQWKQLFETGAAPDSTEAQQLAERILDRNIKTARAQAERNQTATMMNAMPLSSSLGVIRSALAGDPRFADPCGEALYGSKACADFVNEAKNIHARQIAERFAAEQGMRNQPQ